MTKKYRRAISYTIAIIVFIATLAAMLILRNNQNIAEWWTMNISRHWSSAASTVSALVPFSIFEWFIIFAIIIGVLCIIIGIALLVRKKYILFTNGLLAVILSVLIIGNIYIMSAGFSYNRAPLVVEKHDQDYDFDMALNMYNYFAADYNALSSKLKRDEKGDVIMPYSPQELIDKINQEFDKLDKNYYFAHKSNAKPMLNSWFMSTSSILGIAFLPTGEANYNNDIHQTDKPNTIAHEIAHQRGVMREGDANTISEYALLNSQDDYLRYCGYFNAFYNFGTLLRQLNPKMTQDELDKMVQLSQAIKTEKNNSYKRWDEITANPLSKIIGNISSFFNDIYLKLNGLKDGTGDYDNSGEHVDSGETDEDGNIIYKYQLSNAELMYYKIYLNKSASGI